MHSRPPRPRHVYRRRCPRCRCLTPHEDVEREGRVHVGLTIEIPFTDQGRHCYRCGHGWGFMFQREKTWITLHLRPASY